MNKPVNSINVCVIWELLTHSACNRRTTVPSVYCRCRLVGTRCTCWNWVLILQSFWQCGQRHSHEWPAGGRLVGLWQCPWSSFLRADEGRVDGLFPSHGHLFGDTAKFLAMAHHHVQSCRSYTARAASFGLQRLSFTPTTSEAYGLTCKSGQE